MRRVASDRTRLASAGVPKGAGSFRTALWYGPHSPVGPTRSIRALALVAALVAVAASAPLLRVYFCTDDFEHLYRFANYGPTLAVLAAPHGGHLCLVRNPVFAFNYALFGMHAAWFFATVLVTHVANVLLLFAFVRRVTGSASLACFGAVMFAVSPANAGTLGWYSVYGHALAGP